MRRINGAPGTRIAQGERGRGKKMGLNSGMFVLPAEPAASRDLPSTGARKKEKKK